jgi:hypothetical protein
MKRVRQAVGADGFRRRHQRLGYDLPAIDPGPAGVGRLAAKQVDLERFDIEQGEQSRDGGVVMGLVGHGARLTGQRATVTLRNFRSGRAFWNHD